jgi:hypothetical protein
LRDAGTSIASGIGRMRSRAVLDKSILTAGILSGQNI